MEDIARKRLSSVLAEQISALGVPRTRAQRLAQSEVEKWSRDVAGGPFSPPYLVTPHALGWCVTRTLAPIEAEVFETQRTARERARELAAGDGCPVVVCDSSGKVLHRLSPSVPD
jgi:hypothetical protein